MKKMKVNSRLIQMFFVGIFCCYGSSEALAQYSEKKTAISKETLENTALILKPKLNLLSFSHLKAEHCYLPTLGAFCILENKIEKKATFPVKMRLGSVDYVDKLEKKRN